MVLGGWKYFKKEGLGQKMVEKKWRGWIVTIKKTMLNLVDQGILNQCRMNFVAVEEWVFRLVDETHGQL